jgi:oxygen-independent coproporphyrinogen-3 oxidase
VLSLPPLSLYVHLPWCVRKCPYCDFNSHAVKGDFPAEAYVDALLRDLERDLPLVWGRTVHSIFFGGGTPSLFSAAQIERLLGGFRSMLRLAPDVEVTLEANPGTTEHDSFTAYRDAGVNRVSLGVQSFDDDLLRRIGRIHGRREIDRAIRSIQDGGIGNFNIDLMFALPGQSLEQAAEDVRLALLCRPAHLSQYHLTIEPNTAFHASPPPLPAEDLVWDMQEAGAELLGDAGFCGYEVSAWAVSGRECRHNFNYWEYGDYLGIGAGAHGKVTLPSDDAVRRRIRKRHPNAWMEAVSAGDSLAEDRELSAEERVFEFFLNQLRLRRGVNISQFEPRTGVPWRRVAERVRQAVERGLLEERDDMLLHSETGWRFNNEVQAVFLP